MAAAEAEAQRKLDAATIEANNFRMQAMHYTDDMLGNLQNLIHKTMESHMTKYESMMGSLRSFSDILANNRNELAPALNEEDLSDLEE